MRRSLAELALLRSPRNRTYSPLEANPGFAADLPASRGPRGGRGCAIHAIIARLPPSATRFSLGIEATGSHAQTAAGQPLATSRSHGVNEGKHGAQGHHYLCGDGLGGHGGQEPGGARGAARSGESDRAMRLPSSMRPISRPSLRPSCTFTCAIPRVGRPAWSSRHYRETAGRIRQSETDAWPVLRPAASSMVIPSTRDRPVERAEPHHGLRRASQPRRRRPL